MNISEVSEKIYQLMSYSEEKSLREKKHLTSRLLARDVNFESYHKLTCVEEWSSTQLDTGVSDQQNGAAAHLHSDS